MDPNEWNSKEKKPPNKFNSKLKLIHIKQIGAIALFIIGVILIFLSIHAMKKISQAKDFAQGISNFFQHNPTWNPIIKFFGGEAQEKISESYVPATMVMIAGIFFVIIGVIVFWHYRTRKINTKS